MDKNRLYRPNVAMVILSSEYPQKKMIFVAQRSDLRDVWQFPQGGIDDGEDALEALFRELQEEIGTNDVEIISEFPQWLSYDFPPKIALGMKPYIGQRQKYFLVKLKDGAKIDINTQMPEFVDYKFVSLEEVLDLSVGFKKDVYSSVIEYFKKEGFL